MSSSGKNILLVEDDPQDVELTLMALAEYHMANRVKIVHNGAEALEYLYSRESFISRMDGNSLVVLLDLKMPKLNGLQVLLTMKADERLRNIPVVVLTSSRETSDLAECYGSGANAYVVKPVDFSEFMRVVRLIGIFWVDINECPPPPSIREDGKAPHGN